MKKTVFILSAVFALVACSKEKPVTQNDGPIDLSKVVFNFTVKHADDTKAIKTDWAEGDIVYVFFNYTSPQWVKLTRSGSSWTFTNKDGGDDYTGLDLASSGYVTAVYANAATPSIDGDIITFAGAQPGYLLTANAEYTVTSTTEVTTLSATLDMRAPANLIQVYVPGLSAPGSAFEYVLNMTNVKPFTVGAITPGSPVYITPGTANFPLQGVYTTIKGDSGYYFWGVLDEPDESARTYNFQVVTQRKDKKCAVSSKSKTGSATLSGPKAIKLTSLTDNGYFVSMGDSESILWGTADINSYWDSSYGTAVIMPGDHYKWGYTEVYNTEGDEAYFEAFKTKEEFVDVASTVGGRMPTYDEFDKLTYNEETEEYAPVVWISYGGGCLLTGWNGIKLFFPDSGFYYYSSELVYVNKINCYWTTTEYDEGIVWNLQIGRDTLGSDVPNVYVMPEGYVTDGYTVRPVKDVEL